MGNILYRQADINDVDQLPHLIDIALLGGTNYIYSDIIKGVPAFSILEAVLGNDQQHYSYKNTLVAIDNNKVAGLCLSYHAKFHNITEEMTALFSEEKLNYLSNFYNLDIENSLYIEALCVAEKYRGLGIGTKLIKKTIDKASKLNTQFVSLLVFKTNNKAKKLYLSHDFQVSEEINFNNHHALRDKSGALLMKHYL